jgi:hypothetical protein
VAVRDKEQVGRWFLGRNISIETAPAWGAEAVNPLGRFLPGMRALGFPGEQQVYPD